MPRRVNMPTADDLFRPTVVPDVAAKRPGTDGTGEPVEERPKGPSGRVRHDEKVTVYVTADELLDIEHARLELRRHHGLGIDRGRLVREAVALALVDLEENGDASALVRRFNTAAEA